MAEKGATQGPDPGTILALVLGLGTLALFFHVCFNDFIDFDDPVYVTHNEHVQAGLSVEGLLWAVTTTNPSYPQPLTWLSLQLDYELYGLNPAGYHLTNLLLHTANVLLLFGVLRRMTGAVWRSALVAGLFAIHPLHVESVAWVTERKDVLSTLFWILTLRAYIGYAVQPGVLRYLGVVLSLALGLLAKPMLVTLPCVLLLLDYWPLGRLRFRGRPLAPGAISPSLQPRPLHFLLTEKLPLFLLVGASCWMTIFLFKKEGLTEFGDYSPLEIRIANALVSTVAYIRKMLWPFDLAVFYPHPGDTLALWQVIGAGVIVIAITAGVLWAGIRRPYFPVGWFWFLGTLAPVLGLVQRGAQGMADRFTYIPLIGLFLTLAWGLGDLVERRPHHKGVVVSITTACLFIFGVTTWFQVRTWRTSITLWEHALAVTDENYMAHSHLGAQWGEMRDHSEAVAHLREAVRIKPCLALDHANLGAALLGLGRNDEAIASLRKSLSIEPDLGFAHYNLGQALKNKGLTEQAIHHFTAAIRFDPGWADAYYRLAVLFAQQKKWKRAVQNCREAVRLRPREPRYLYALADFLTHSGDQVGAEAVLREAGKLQWHSP
jgi:tetratricopeptide (TPR) repeat protein